MKKSLYNLARNMLYSFTYIVSKPAEESTEGNIFCYHSISNDTWDFSTSKKTLTKQLTYLKENFEAFTASDLEKYLQGKKKISKPFFVITFDDGYKNIYSTKELFKKMGIKPIVFLLANTKNPDRKELDNAYKFLSTEEIKDLMTDGWVFGCHGDSHINFTTATASQLNMEIKEAKSKLERNLNTTINYFAYPKGNYTEDIKEMVKDSGYKLAFSMDSKMLSTESDCYALPRIGIMNSHSFMEFKSLPLSMSTKIRGILLNKRQGKR